MEWETEFWVFFLPKRRKTVTGSKGKTKQNKPEL